MRDQWEKFKKEASEISFFSMKLIMHLILAAVILLFVLCGFWVHKAFNKLYLAMETPEVAAAPKPAPQVSEPEVVDHKLIVNGPSVGHKLRRRPKRDSISSVKPKIEESSPSLTHGAKPTDLGLKLHCIKIQEVTSPGIELSFQSQKKDLMLCYVD